MRISVVHDPTLSEAFLRKMSQLGVDCIDFSDGTWLPGVAEQGYPDLDELLAIKGRLQSWGLEINRVSLPDMTETFMLEQEGADRELENAVRALKVLGEAGVPIARQRFHGDTFNHLMTPYTTFHRGGYRSHGDRLSVPGAAEEASRAQRVQVWDSTSNESPPQEALNSWWDRFCQVYSALVPIAEEFAIKLAMHPSDVPLPDTPFGSLGYHRLIDAFPSRRVGYLYCCGTRVEAGGLPLVLDEIHNYGRKGRIFMIHLRNIRGSLATAGAYEEVALDDGDMNIFRILLELRRVGFDGCINPDHMAVITTDYETGNQWTPRLRKWLDASHTPDTQVAHQGLAFAVGYIKALLTALDEFSGGRAGVG